MSEPAPTVPISLTLETVRGELAVAADFAAAVGLELDRSPIERGEPLFTVTFVNTRAERFSAEFDCRDYPMHPPTIEFIDPATGARGIRRLYPSIFHGMPCVCARYNRKAYGERAGPHGEWRLVDWRLPTGGGVAVDSLALMISDLQGKIVASAGRLE